MASPSVANWLLLTGAVFNAEADQVAYEVQLDEVVYAENMPLAIGAACDQQASTSQPVLSDLGKAAPEPECKAAEQRKPSWKVQAPTAQVAHFASGHAQLP